MNGARQTATHVRGLRLATAAAVLSLSAGLCAGCGGRGQIQLAALNYREIDPPAPRIISFDVQHAYWWIDEDGAVWIGLESDRSWLLIPEHLTFQLSLVLERLPAGRMRDYKVSQRELRGVLRFGPAENRFESISGIVALYRDPGDRLRGSVRLDVARFGRQMLDWTGPSRYLLLGTFVAVSNEERGRLIAAATEAEGWARVPAPQSQPSTAPAKPR